MLIAFHSSVKTHTHTTHTHTHTSWIEDNCAACSNRKNTRDSSFFAVRITKSVVIASSATNRRNGSEARQTEFIDRSQSLHTEWCPTKPWLPGLKTLPAPPVTKHAGHPQTLRVRLRVVGGVAGPRSLKSFADYRSPQNDTEATEMFTVLAEISSSQFRLSRHTAWEDLTLVNTSHCLPHSAAWIAIQFHRILSTEEYRFTLYCLHGNTFF